MTLDRNHPLLKNHPLRFAVEEFALADRACRRMVEIGIGDFTEYEKAWRDFLHRIERVWVKTRAAVCGMPGWQKIESELVSLRKTDPLLLYLHQARHVDEHTISDLAKDWDPKLTGTQKGNELELSWQPWDRPLLPVKNRGVTFDPPKTHMGKSIEDQKGQGKAEPRLVAELALRFYVEFLKRVSLEVVGDKRDV